MRSKKEEGAGQAIKFKERRAQGNRGVDENRRGGNRGGLQRRDGSSNMH